jgi:hypothetical protein
MKNQKNYLETLKLNKSQKKVLKGIASENVSNLLQQVTSISFLTTKTTIGVHEKKAERGFNEDSKGFLFDYWSNRVQNFLWGAGYEGRASEIKVKDENNNWTINKFCPKVVKDFFHQNIVTHENKGAFEMKELNELENELIELEMKQIMIKRKIANIKRQQGKNFQDVQNYVKRLNELNVSPEQLSMIENFQTA